jgi:hypothetical protein
MTHAALIKLPYKIMSLLSKKKTWAAITLTTQDSKPTADWSFKNVNL